MQTNPITTGPDRGIDGLKQRAAALIDSGQADVAIAMLTGPAMKGMKPDADVHYLLGHAELTLSHPQEALLHLRRSNAARKNTPLTLFDLARAHHLLGNLKQADAALLDLLRAAPSDGRAIAFRARMMGERGDPRAGIALLEEAIGRISPSGAAVTMLASLCQQAGERAKGLDAVRDLLDDPTSSPDLRRSCLFIKGHLLDAEGEYGEAFAAYDRANAMLPEGEAMRLDRLRDFWTPGRIAELEPVDENRSELPLLVVGMPRSGTTLTEQILASHPQVDTVGESPVLGRAARKLTGDELGRQRFQEIGRVYLDHLESVGAGRGTSKRPSRVVDKMPENYTALGVVRFALPGARVINCVRDARDVCLSIFFQDFGPALQYATRLGTIAEQYRFYLGAMEHWREHLGLATLDWSYEALTAEPEARVRELLEFSGLGFHERCLRFNESKRSVRTASVSQVRQGIYTSSRQRWRNYEPYIGQLIADLDGL